MILRSALLFTTLLLLIVKASHGQADFRPGEIFLISGDTLLGQIDLKGDLGMSEYCNFKGNDLKTIRFTPADLLGYRFIGGAEYKSQKIDGIALFLEYLYIGRVSILYSRTFEKDRYYIEKSDLGMREIPYIEEFKFKDGSNYIYKSTRHVGVIKLYMSDADVIHDKITKIKKPNHDNLITIADDYQKLFSDGIDPYNDKKKVNKFMPEVLLGHMTYSDLAESGKQFGLITHLWWPRANARFYFRTGLLVVPSAVEESFAFIKIPLMVEYKYPKYLLEPKAGIGVSFLFPFHTTVSMMAGLNLNITKKIHLSLTYDIDFLPKEKIFIIPETLYSNALSGGIYFGL